RILGRNNPDRGADHRQSRQWRGAAAIRMDIRQYRARKHDGDRVWTWRYFLLAVRLSWDGAVGLRAFRRPHIPHLGRDLQSVPFDLHRHLWSEIRNGELEPAVHGERDFGVSG